MKGYREDGVLIDPEEVRHTISKLVIWMHDYNNRLERARMAPPEIREDLLSRLSILFGTINGAVEILQTMGISADYKLDKASRFEYLKFEGDRYEA